MRTLEFQDYPDRSRDSLAAFLNDCRKRAREKGRFQIASISLQVRNIDPLAVLESIFAPHEWHFYLERGEEGWALAGADEVVSCQVEGPERFGLAREFVREVLENTVAIGDLEVPFSGPHFFGGFTFFDTPGEGSPFPGGALFLPRWQVSRSVEGNCAVANVKVTPEADVEVLADTVWRAHARFSAFDYTAPAGESVPASSEGFSPGLRHREVRSGAMTFREAVAGALEDIGRGRYRKIVLARAIDLSLGKAINPLHALNDLRLRYPESYGYSLANGRGHSFIGASPERLLRVRGGRLLTEALAGSAPRGQGAAEDVLLGEKLLRSDKDLREHALVLDSVCRRLRAVGLAPESAPVPRLLSLPNVRHLHTPVEAPLPESVDLFTLLSTLHPTPAVGGTPREAACAAIPHYEPFDRGLYAGPVGWVDCRGEGEFTVAIRSALVGGDLARVFAGAGIVEGSDPEAEWRETELKFRTLLEALARSG